jgi:hypothetical protein
MPPNSIKTDGFSNPESKVLYSDKWPNEPRIRALYEDGNQCGGCSFFAEFNEDYGLCCHKDSRHHLETVFEHFSCESHVNEGWGPHSFDADPEYHCWCGGDQTDYLAGLVKAGIISEERLIEFTVSRAQKRRQ